MDARSVLWYAARPNESIGHLPYSFRMRIVRARYKAWWFNIYRKEPLTLI